MTPGLAARVIAIAVMTAIGMTVPTAALGVTVGFSDARGDVSSGFDIHRVKVANERRVAVTVTHRELRPSGGGGLTVYFDTRPLDPGPEFVASGGLAATRDWNVYRTEGWTGSSSIVLCRIDMRVNYTTDTSQFVMDRACLSSPGKIRVSVVAGGTNARDWAPGFHRFYPWVMR